MRPSKRPRRSVGQIAKLRRAFANGLQRLSDRLEDERETQRTANTVSEVFSTIVYVLIFIARLLVGFIVALLGALALSDQIITTIAHIFVLPFATAVGQTNKARFVKSGRMVTGSVVLIAGILLASLMWKFQGETMIALDDAWSSWIRSVWQAWFDFWTAVAEVYKVIVGVYNIIASVIRDTIIDSMAAFYETTLKLLGILFSLVFAPDTLTYCPTGYPMPILESDCRSRRANGAYSPHPPLCATKEAVCLVVDLLDQLALLPTTVLDPAIDTVLAWFNELLTSAGNSWHFSTKSKVGIGITRFLELLIDFGWSLIDGFVDVMLELVPGWSFPDTYPGAAFTTVILNIPREPRIWT